MLRIGLVILLVWAVCPTMGWAAPPADQILPATTKGLMSIPDVEDLQERWRKTQLGVLSADPVMKPFSDGLRRQIRERLVKSRFHVSLDWSDVLEVCGGELALATLQPEENGSLGHASVLYVDVTGKQTEAQALLDDAAQQLSEKGATKQVRQVAGVEFVVHTLPRQRGEAEAATVVRVLTDDVLLLGNHEAVCQQILERIQGDANEGGLDSVPAYQAVMNRVEKAASDSEAPQIRWFMQPFDYADVVRASRTGPKKRGTDMLAILKSQGFDAVEGIGGWIHVSTADTELLHRTFIHAPGKTDADERFRLAARMLDFPNGNEFGWPDWVPRELAMAMTLRWNVKDAFEYSKTLVDAITNDEDFFEDLLKSIRDDPNGPRIDVRKGFVAFLDDHVTVISDHIFPITPQSERILVAIRVTDAEAVAKTVHQALITDPNANRLEIEGFTVWEIIEEEEEGPDLNLEIPGVAPVQAAGGNQGLPNSAVAVAHGHFMVATHVDFLRRILKERDAEDKLSLSEDAKLIQTHLDKAGAGEDSLRFFSRTDESYRPTYELIRQGKMPESESMFGRLLNRILGPDDEDVLREQSIDGSTLPDYQAVRRYLGPAGAFSRTEADGWYTTGILLDKKSVFPAGADEVADSQDAAGQDVGNLDADNQDAAALNEAPAAAIE